MLFDKLLGLFDGCSLVSRVLERPGDVSRDPQHVRVEAIRCALINKGGVGLPASIPLLLPGKPLLRSRDEFRIHVVDLRHVVELHQPVSSKDFVGGSLAEPRESSTGNLERQQPLIAIGDVSLRLGMHLRSELLSALHVIERQHVGISARRSLLKAATRHAQNAIHAFDDLAKRAGIKPHKNLAGLRNGVSRKIDLVLHRRFQSPVEHQVLLAPVGNDFDLPNHDVGTIRSTLHACRKRELELPDALGFDRELRSSDARRLYRDRFLAHVIDQ